MAPARLRQTDPHLSQDLALEPKRLGLLEDEVSRGGLVERVDRLLGHLRAHP